MKSRLITAALFFAAGIAFICVAQSMQVTACNDSCPEWFEWAVMAQLLFPVLWGAVGYAAKRGSILVSLMLTCALSSALSYGLYHQTIFFTMRAISG